MNAPGASAEDLAATRSVLLDALEALAPHLAAVVLIGAQAVYLRTGRANVALAEMTKDNDLALDARHLSSSPLIENLMTDAAFCLATDSQQPGSWVGRGGIPVDLMVPEALSGRGGRRGARIPPHSKRATRRARGLEAAIVDHSPMRITSLRTDDRRSCTVEVAGPAALLVAKLHKLGERRDTPDRLLDKDAHDLYRLLVAIPTDELAAPIRRLEADALAGEVTKQAATVLDELFGAGPEALGCVMAGRAEQGIGEPATVAAAAAALAADLIAAVGDTTDAPTQEDVQEMAKQVEP